MNKKSCDRMQTFEHDKTHPFDYTMAYNNNCIDVCMHFFSTAVSLCEFFFLFGSSFAYLIRLDEAIERLLLMSMLDREMRRVHSWDVDVSQTRTSKKG